jgi:hypothetical protein
VRSYLPDVADASRTAESADAGTVVVRAAGLRVRGGPTAVPAGAAPSQGDLAVFCRPVVTAPAVVRRDGRVLAGGWLPDLVRLGELERHLGDGVIEELVDTAIAKGRLKARQRRRIMSYPLVIRLMLAMALMPDASYCESQARLAGLLADIPFVLEWHVPTEKVVTNWRMPVPAEVPRTTGLTATGSGWGIRPSPFGTGRQLLAGAALYVAPRRRPPDGLGSLRRRGSGAASIARRSRSPVAAIARSWADRPARPPQEQTTARLRLGAAYDVPGLAILFGDGAGAPKWPQDVRRHFQTLCGRADIGEGLDGPASSGTRSSRRSRTQGGPRADRRCSGARQLHRDQGRVSAPDR